MDAKGHLDKANELKLEGNDLFRASKWTAALVSYRTALSHLPPRKRSAEPESDQADVDSARQPSTGDPDGGHVTDIPSALDVECGKARAVLYANIGACLAKLVSRPSPIHELISSHPNERTNRRTTKEWWMHVLKVSPRAWHNYECSEQ